MTVRFKGRKPRARPRSPQSEVEPVFLISTETASQVTIKAFAASGDITGKLFDTISESDDARLARNETRISQGLASFVEVGEALSDIFPLQLDKVREVDISRLLLECEQAGLLFRYTAAAKATLIINRWEQGRAKDSKYPPPPPDICLQMQTYVFIGKHMSPTPTPNSDTDTDNKPVLPDLLSTDGFRAKWAEYLVYRRTTGMRALRSVSVAKKWTEMAAWGHDAAIASIEATIKNGWQGIFQPKGPAGGSPLAKLASEFDQF